MSHELAIVAGPANGRNLSKEEIELIKTTIAKGATDSELALFILHCNRTGLDPFARQIYAVKRYDSALQREVMSVQTSIDGLRLIAERTGDYDGQDAPEWCNADGVWYELWTDTKTPPFAARVKIYRKGISRPFVGIAKYSAYVQTKRDGSPNNFWSRMSDHMIAKVAEALAFRKAFPQETSGIYTREEMGEQAADETSVIQSSVSKPAISESAVTFSSQDSAEPNGGQSGETSGEATAAPSAETKEQLEMLIQYISAGQAANLHKQFRKAVEQYHPAKALESDDKLYAWLKKRGYVDKDENGTASRIPASGWFKIRDEALEFAKTLDLSK